MITVNGKIYDGAGMTVMELLEKEGYPKTAVAVECNEEIIPKSKFETHRFAENDVIEIVRFVGGGSI